MDLHDYLRQHHHTIRSHVTQVTNALAASNYDQLSNHYDTLYQSLRKHLQDDSIYYKSLDQGKKITDRTLMHDLRNDHAALMFALDGLLMRLKKSSWKEFADKWAKFTGVLLPHFDNEEKTLFPLAASLLSPKDQADILKTIEHPE